MNFWTPLEEHELLDIVNQAWKRMNLPERRLWEAIRIEPQKWQLDPWGKEGNGFWVVGIFGNRAIWYNDIEEGFNTSTWRTLGVLGEYWCNQDELEWTVNHLRSEIESNNPTGKARA